MPYSVGNKVRQDGAVYKCNTAIPARGEEWNPNHWTKIDPLQTQIDNLAQTSSGIPYAICESNASSQIKNITLAGVTQPTDGMMIRVHFSASQDYDGQPKLRLNSDSSTDAYIVFSLVEDAEKGAWDTAAELLLAYNSNVNVWQIVGHGPAYSNCYGLMSPKDKDKLDVLEVGGQNMMLDWLEPYIDDIAGYGNTTVTRNVKMEVGNGYVYNATRVQHTYSQAYSQDRRIFYIGGETGYMVNNQETGETGKKYAFAVWIKNNHSTSDVKVSTGFDLTSYQTIAPGESV